MCDLNQKKLTFKYGTLGKPVQISDKTLGIVKINYDSDGRIVKTDTELRGRTNRRPTQEESQEVIKRILTGFQNLLDIIRPAVLAFYGDLINEKRTYFPYSKKTC